MDTEVASAATAADLEQARAVRLRVFVEEQGVPLDLELDEHDAAADHFVARAAGRTVGTARLLADGEGVLGRLAVLPEARGTGLGAALVRAVEDRARARGLPALRLHAQTSARGFYERLGYAAFGPVEDEAGIPHIWMRKDLRRPAS
ncbi:GNAT family N-acetyltransferase [Actinomadura parmotrematis]|uniref:GNAT family N-acetyltransferase n=1 Tax=Actinomadura parmotrematis TaxID=2864039 RepID=A0ABS7FL01_9ACTN|nr:GNAT family N-acetyltransferase [Actinomadura parmotrematis]MBW8481037.1 GNAT family N-acetyltransferase [Actinomadura parmotrematis]